MSDVLLVYPYSQPRRSRSIFRFPPLGLAYVAAALRQAGRDVEMLDGTFMSEAELTERAVDSRAEVTGVYSMVTLQGQSLRLARRLRGRTGLLVAGGPLPTCDPASYLDDFDAVVRGEGEVTMVELLKAVDRGGGRGDFGAIAGLAFRGNGPGSCMMSQDRPKVERLDDLAFPARDLLPNGDYLDHGRRKYGHCITSVITSRGCPFHCEFCSNAVFGVSYRERTARNVVDEVQAVLEAGYDRIHFADDVFTLNTARLLAICSEIENRRLKFSWECLARVDCMDHDVAAAMRAAGCDRVFFGIESGDDSVLRLMGKQISHGQAAAAVKAARDAGLESGAFFIVCYPGETDATVLDTIRFATRLPLDYVSFTMPYPLPGTRLLERVNGAVDKEWVQPKGAVTDHVCIYRGDFSERKMKFAILKGRVQALIRRRLGRRGLAAVLPFEKATDALFRAMK